jgi:hypothetical protein
MEVRWITTYIDTMRGRDALAAEVFWQAVTGTTISERRGEHGEFATLIPPDGDAFVKVQRTNSGVPSCHLDFHLDDAEAGVGRAVDLGATITARNDDFVVGESPGGTPFCVMWHLGEHVRPVPIKWPGQRSIVDQVCIDIPPANYDVETQFWSQFTGWPLRGGSLSEFNYLERPAGMPLRLLLQRLDDAGGGAAVRAHVDFACDDVETEAQRHIALGAQFMRRRSWVTMLDPVGREHCVTGRKP